MGLLQALTGGGYGGNKFPSYGGGGSAGGYPNQPTYGGNMWGVPSGGSGGGINPVGWGTQGYSYGSQSPYGPSGNPNALRGQPGTYSQGGAYSPMRVQPPSSPGPTNTNPNTVQRPGGGAGGGSQLRPPWYQNYSFNQGPATQTGGTSAVAGPRANALNAQEHGRQMISSGQAKNPGLANYALYQQTAQQRFGSDPGMMANLQGAMPSGMGLATLPGATMQDKVNYALNYLQGGYQQGVSAYDMIARSHDPSMMRSHPVSSPGGSMLSDPAAAAAKWGAGSNTGTGSAGTFQQSPQKPQQGASSPIPRSPWQPMKQNKW